MPDCSRCGSHIEDGEKVCPSCGAPSEGLTESFEPVGAEAGFDTGLDTVEGPVLMVRKGPQPGEMFYLDRPRLTVGRDPGSDIFLNDMTVSRTHAVLEVASGGVTVTDSGSLNGTYVNGTCVENAQLTEGDVVQIGTFQMVYHGESAPR